jgi:hypothetical protein
MSERTTQRCRRLLRFQQGIGKPALIFDRHMNNLGFIDSSTRRVVRRGNDEIRQGATLDLCGALQQRVDVCGHPSLETRDVSHGQGVRHIAVRCKARRRTRRAPAYPAAALTP